MVIRGYAVNKFLLFMVLSVVILVIIRLSKDYSKEITLKIKPIQLPETSTLLINDSLTFTVTLRTNGYNWLRYRNNAPYITVNFKNDVINQDSIYVWNAYKSFFKVASQLPPDVSLEAIKTKQLQFRYNTHTKKKVPIKLNASITFNKGYGTLNDFEILPDSVTVIAPEHLLKEINSIKTDTLNLTQVKASFVKTLGLNSGLISNEIKLSPKQVQLRVEAERFTEGITEVPVIIVNAPANKNLKHFPKFVKISYNTSLKAFKTIVSTDFKVICDYNKADKNNSILIPQLVKLPDNVKNARIHQQNIEYILTE